MNQPQRNGLEPVGFDVLALASKRLKRPVTTLVELRRQSADMIDAKSGHYLQNVVAVSVLSAQLEIGFSRARRRGKGTPGEVLHVCFGGQGRFDGCR